jgi:hypothetical protein
MKQIIFILLILLSFNLSAQQLDSIEQKQLEAMESFFFELNKSSFNEGELHSKLNKDYILPWKTEVDCKELQNSLDSLILNSSIEITPDEEGKSNLSLVPVNGSFPTEISGSALIVNVKDCRLVNSNKDSIEVNQEGSINYRTGLSDKKANLDFSILTEDIEGVQGEVTFEGKTFSHYEYKAITKADINKLIELDGIEFKIVDIYKNKILVANPVEADGQVFDKVKMVNVDSSAYRIAQIAYFTFEAMKEKDPSITGTSCGESKQTINPVDYLIFKNNPSISLEDYNKLINEDEKILKMLETANIKLDDEGYIEDDYVLFCTPGEIENAYFYLPVYKTKEFSLKIN